MLAYALKKAWAGQAATKPPFLRLGLGLVFGGLWLGYGLKVLVGDYGIARRQIEGVVEEAYLTHGKNGTYFHVRINGQHDPILRGPYEAMTVGERVRVEVGTGSGMIFHTARLAEAER